MLKINIQLFAHKKGVSSTRNGAIGIKASRVKRGDASLFWQATFSASARHQIHPGAVLDYSDDTLFALVDGRVKFERMGKDRKRVCVYAVG